MNRLLSDLYYEFQHDRGRLMLRGYVVVLPLVLVISFFMLDASYEQVRRTDAVPGILMILFWGWACWRLGTTRKDES